MGRVSFDSQDSTSPLLPSDHGDLELCSGCSVNRKIDIHLLPLLSLLYLFNGLDRGNIGNAQTQGLTDDIDVSPDDLNFAVSIFFVAFVFFQPISTGIGRWMGPNRWLPIMMMCWGLMTMMQVVMHGRGALITTRLLIGVFEAGFYPTSIVYLGYFYSPFDLATRIALFFGQYAIASAFSGALSYGIFQISHPSLKPWQILFLIEGTLTCILAVVAWMWLPVGPQTAWFLTEDERELIKERVEPGPQIETNWKADVMETLRDGKLWFILLCNICASVPATAFSVFLPLVVEGMGYTAIKANLMSVPPAVCGAFGVYMFAWSSDRQRERGYHIVGALMIALVGLVGLITSRSNAGKYAALCIFIFGSYVPPPLTAAWLSNNTPAGGKRALAIGINGWGNLAGVVGSQLYRTEYAPEYKLPLFVTLGFIGVALPGYLGYRCMLQAVNKRRGNRYEEEGEAGVEGLSGTDKSGVRSKRWVVGCPKQLVRTETASPRLINSPLPDEGPRPLLPLRSSRTVPAPKTPCTITTMPKTPRSSSHGSSSSRPPASERDRLPVHPRKNKVPDDQRKRVQAACNECNVRRVKCSGKPPCTQCMNNKRSCRFPRSDPKRTVSAHLYDYYSFKHRLMNYLAGMGPTPDTDELEAEMRYLEMEEWQEIYTKTDSYTLARSKADLGLFDARMLIDSGGSTRIFGRSSGTYFLDGVKEIMSVSGPLCHVVEPSRSQEREYSAQFVESLGQYQTYDSRPLMFSEPNLFDSLPTDEDVVRLFKLVSTFLTDGNGRYDSGGVLYMPLPRVAIWNVMVRRIREAQAGGTRVPWSFKGEFMLGHAVIAFAHVLGATSPGSKSEGYGKLGEANYTAASVILGNPFHGGSYTKKEIPVIILMTLWMLENNRRDQAYAIFGLATHTAIATGLHEGYGSDEHDVRLFWSLYVIDRWLACILGRPCKIADDEIETRLPQEVIGLPPPHGLIGHIKLARLQHVIVHEGFKASRQQNAAGQDGFAATRIKRDLLSLDTFTKSLHPSCALEMDPIDITLTNKHILGATEEELELEQRESLEKFPSDRGLLALQMSLQQLMIVAVRPAYLAAVQKAIASIAEVDNDFDLDEDPLAPAIEMCTRAAQRNLRLAWLMQQNSPGRKLLLPDLHHIFNAALILIMHQIITSNYRVSIKSEIDWAYDLFTFEASLGSRFAEDCVGVLGGFCSLASVLHGVIHSTDAKQHLWDTKEPLMKDFLDLPMPKYTFSFPQRPPTSSRYYHHVERTGRITVATLFDVWKTEAKYLLYSRPLS
ncbi:high-affinity nicotinic acid transporter [Podospora fimiseda]|uniref:High-affinity nicotinic acid transporter n=1 Tax=Podospora fimiseda TaxID=252190 RepID=A0AAN7BSD2_9PEZI|nr:high-affinity nicotinic acid transporter [Podospora fimiseda]